MFDNRKNYIGGLEVLESAAGFYIGRLFYYDKDDYNPYSRESCYYPTKELAQYHLENKSWVENFN